MKKLLIFGGTTEGRIIAERCAAKKLGIQIIVIERPQEEGYYVNKAWGIIMLLRDNT
ncbi:MAG: hypothetical protein IKH50_08250 [Oscillospiraceae bacterium]|nr:hypothetical protein [Oscillospiraceae bacterium]